MSLQALGIFQNQKTPLSKKAREILERKADQLEQLRTVLEQERQLVEAGLLDWIDDQLKEAEARVLRLAETRAPHYEKHEAAGILREWKRKKGVLSERSNVEFQQQLAKELEETYDRLSEDDGRQSRRPDSVPYPFGEF